MTFFSLVQAQSLLLLYLLIRLNVNIDQFNLEQEYSFRKILKCKMLYLKNIHQFLNRILKKSNYH